MSELGTPASNQRASDQKAASDRPTADAIKVSVVVPVYNPGRYLDDCLSSLFNQTLPSTEYEAIFVDDGSTDDTPERLDKLAAEHDFIRVIHIPNSGWPGRPRNLGTDAAAGEYVQYVDQDDSLAPDALRRLYDLGHRNGSDIVIGKVVSNWRGVPSGLWAETHDSVTINDFPLWDSLTPHKMFRRAFLADNDIRFPEGKRRLEDQVFMMKAYFPARAVSILSDYTCYFYWRRDDKANAGSRPIEPHGYYTNLREVLDVVEQNTEPGTFRDTILRRFYRVEILGRLSDRNVLRYDDDYRKRMFDEVHKIAVERIPATVPEKLPVLFRLRSELLFRDDLPGRMELARRCSEVKPRAQLERAEWRSGVLELEFVTELLRADGQPLRIVRRDDGVYLDPELLDGVLDWRLGEITPELSKLRTEVSLRERESVREWRVSVKQRIALEDLTTGETVSVRSLPDSPADLRAYIQTTVRIDPERAAGQDQLERGVWDVRVRARMFGFDQRIRLGARAEDQPNDPALAALVGTPPMVVIPYLTAHGNLSLDVNRRAQKLADHLPTDPVVPVASDGCRLQVNLPVASHGGTASIPIRVDLRPDDQTAGDQRKGTATDESAAGAESLPGLLQPLSDRAQLVVDLRHRRDLRERLRVGRWRLFGHLDDNDTVEIRLVGVNVDHRSRAFIEGAARINEVRRVTRQLVHSAVERPRLRRIARRVMGGLPRPVRERVKSLVGRVRSR